MLALLRDIRAWFANPVLDFSSIPPSAFRIIQPMI